MSDNWVVQNLENALETWNEKLSEIWTLITTTPQNFKGGNIWKVIVDINGAVQAIGLVSYRKVCTAVGRPVAQSRSATLPLIFGMDLQKKAGKTSVHRRNCSAADMLRILWRVSS